MKLRVFTENRIVFLTSKTIQVTTSKIVFLEIYVLLLNNTKCLPIYELIAYKVLAKFFIFIIKA